MPFYDELDFLCDQDSDSNSRAKSESKIFTQEDWDVVKRNADFLLPTCVIDFSCLPAENEQSLFENEKLLERAYIFRFQEDKDWPSKVRRWQEEGGQIRLILHVHTKLKWKERNSVDSIRGRVKTCNACNFRYSFRVPGSRTFRQTRKMHQKLQVHDHEVILKLMERAHSMKSLSTGPRDVSAHLMDPSSTFCETDFIDESDSATRGSSIQFEIITWQSYSVRSVQLAGFSVGINTFEDPSFPYLEFALSDATMFHQNLHRLGAKCEILENPKSRGDIIQKFRNFLGSLQSLPEVFIFYCASHAIQNGAELYILPSEARSADDHDLEDTCLPHSRIFKFLKADLEDSERFSDSSFRPLCLVILDTCRSENGIALTDGYRASCPRRWARVLSCSRGGKAIDRDSFTSELLHPGLGIFSPDVPLKEGIEQAKRRFMKRFQNQEPNILIDHIENDICLNVALLSPASLSVAAQENRNRIVGAVGAKLAGFCSEIPMLHHDSLDKASLNFLIDSDSPSSSSSSRTVSSWNTNKDDGDKYGLLCCTSLSHISETSEKLALLENVCISENVEKRTKAMLALTSFMKQALMKEDERNFWMAVTEEQWKTESSQREMIESFNDFFNGHTLKHKIISEYFDRPSSEQKSPIKFVLNKYIQSNINSYGIKQHWKRCFDILMQDDNTSVDVFLAEVNKKLSSSFKNAISQSIIAPLGSFLVLVPMPKILMLVLQEQLSLSMKSVSILHSAGFCHVLSSFKDINLACLSQLNPWSQETYIYLRKKLESLSDIPFRLIKESQSCFDPSSNTKCDGSSSQWVNSILFSENPREPGLSNEIPCIGEAEVELLANDNMQSKALAVAMSKHWRLGEGSMLREFSDFILHRIICLFLDSEQQSSVSYLISFIKDYSSCCSLNFNWKESPFGSLLRRKVAIGLEDSTHDHEFNEDSQSSDQEICMDAQLQDEETKSPTLFEADELFILPQVLCWMQRSKCCYICISGAESADSLKKLALISALHMLYLLDRESFCVLKNQFNLPSLDIILEMKTYLCKARMPLVISARDLSIFLDLHQTASERLTGLNVLLNFIKSSFDPVFSTMFCSLFCRDGLFIMLDEFDLLPDDFSRQKLSSLLLNISRSASDLNFGVLAIAFSGSQSLPIGRKFETFEVRLPLQAIERLETAYTATANGCAESALQDAVEGLVWSQKHQFECEQRVEIARTVESNHFDLWMKALATESISKEQLTDESLLKEQAENLQSLEFKLQESRSTLRRANMAKRIADQQVDLAQVQVDHQKAKVRRGWQELEAAVREYEAFESLVRWPPASLNS